MLSDAALLVVLAADRIQAMQAAIGAPRPFDPALLALCEEAVREETGEAPRLPSGPLHDAAEMVPHMPVVMMFSSSSRGLSHCKEEDTPIHHLEKTIGAFLRLVDKTVAHVARG